MRKTEFSLGAQLLPLEDIQELLQFRQFPCQERGLKGFMNT